MINVSYEYVTKLITNGCSYNNYHMRYHITSEFDTIIITCFTASVLVLLTLFCPQIVRDQECSQMSDVRHLNNVGLRLPQDHAPNIFVFLKHCDA